MDDLKFLCCEAALSLIYLILLILRFLVQIIVITIEIKQWITVWFAVDDPISHNNSHI